MMKRSLIYGIIFFALVISTNAKAADILKSTAYFIGKEWGSLTYMECNKDSVKQCHSDLMILGNIEKGDHKKFRNALRELKQSNYIIGTVSLDSPGGDVIESIKIGKMIRENLLYTEAPRIRLINNKPLDAKAECPSMFFSTVPTDTLYKKWVEKRKDGSCSCDSACFFIWSAGVIRVGNYIGMHRPYFAKEYFQGLTSSDARKKYGEMSDSIRKYLKSMDIPNDIIDEMFNHSSQEIHYLYKHFYNGDIKQIREVPFYEEWILAKCGPGLTKEEVNTFQELLFKEYSPYKKLSRIEKITLQFLDEERRKRSSCIDEARMAVQLKAKD